MLVSCVLHVYFMRVFVSSSGEINNMMLFRAAAQTGHCTERFDIVFQSVSTMYL